MQSSVDIFSQKYEDLTIINCATVTELECFKLRLKQHIFSTSEYYPDDGRSIAIESVIFFQSQGFLRPPLLLPHPCFEQIYIFELSIYIYIYIYTDTHQFKVGLKVGLATQLTRGCKI